MLAAAVCPHPPLLIPLVAAGAAPELDGLRTSCLGVVAELVGLDPDVVVVVGDSPTGIEADGTAVGSLAGFGIDVNVGATTGASSDQPTLPLALAVGAWLLDQAGWDGRRRYVGVPSATTGTDSAALGARLAGDAERIVVLVMGDGSARRSTTAPGYLDPRAAPFDAAVASALATADGAALLSLDAELAVDLLVAGRASWQVLSGLISADVASTGRSWSGDLIADIAPYGVGYLVATVYPEPATG